MMLNSVWCMSINQQFSYGQIRATFVSTTDEILMNAARYQVRLIQSRASLVNNAAPILENISRFSLILAHVIEATGFPFAIPDPLAHPETVGLAWDVYMTDSVELWEQLLIAIDTSTNVRDQIEDLLPAATEELQILSAHHISPFKRKEPRPIKHGSR